MGKLLHFVTFLLLVAAQPAQPQELSKRDGAADRALRGLHEILRQPPGPGDAKRHDAYLSLVGLGNEETMPLLLERLRLDYGESEPIPPPGVKFGFVCTQVHLIDAIRSIANTDQGMFYPRWEKWWEANRRYPRLKWILDGFTEGGLHAIDPPDEKFGLELIEALAGKREYYAVNARRLLVRVLPRERAAWLISAAASDQRPLRLGALSDLEQIDTSSHDDLIRKLTSDTDQEVREVAASVLRKRQAVKR